MESTTTPTTTNNADVASPFAATKGVLLITNSDQVPADSYGFTVALALAVRSHVPVTLYDRSEETWGDSQHPEGPLVAGDAQLSERTALAEQIGWLNDHEVVGQGWVATLPSISAVLTALAQVGADVVIVPGSLSRNLFERALEGSSLAETLVEQISRNEEVDAVVFEIDDNGAATRIDA